MTKFIFALLSALIILSLPKQETPINNMASVSESKTVSATAPEKVVQVETPKITATTVTPPVISEKQPTPPIKVVAVAAPPTDRQLLMQQAGIPRADWSAVDYIVSHESSWRPTATNSSSGAHGLCQSLPASKMASAGKDYMTNPVTQLRWCHHYAMNRYSSWWSAHAFWQANRWW